MLDLLAFVLGITYVLTWFRITLQLTVPDAVWKSNRYTDKLAIRVINYDGGSIGEAVVNAAVSSICLSTDNQLTSRSSKTAMHPHTPS